VTTFVAALLVELVAMLLFAEKEDADDERLVDIGELVELAELDDAKAGVEDVAWLDAESEGEELPEAGFGLEAALSPPPPPPPQAASAAVMQNRPANGHRTRHA
jgi:hypothetical protein